MYNNTTLIFGNKYLETMFAVSSFTIRTQAVAIGGLMTVVSHFIWNTMLKHLALFHFSLGGALLNGYDSKVIPWLIFILGIVVKFQIS
jgi:hypothetical protein